MTVKRRARRRRDPARLARALVVLGALAGTRAAAHPELSALGTKRYVTAAILDGRVDVTDAWLEGTLAAGDERGRLDGDGDGTITDAELAAAEARLAAEAPALAVEVDGRALAAPVAVAIDIGDERRANDAPVVVERHATYPGAWPAGAHRLRVVVAREPARVLDTELGIVLAPGYALAGGTDLGTDLVTFRGPRVSALEERAATFEIISSGGPPPAKKRAPRPPLAGLAALVVAVGALALLWRARRSAR